MNKQKVICGADKPDEIPPGREAKKCAQCMAWFHLPRCHALRHRCCSSECNRELRIASRTARAKNCEKCGGAFVPRPSQVEQGRGRFCSVACMATLLHTYRTPEMEARRISAMKDRIAKGEWTYRRGKDNPQWTGGSAAAQARRTASGAAAKYNREYRKANPDRAREWVMRRRVGTKLPYGTIPKIRMLQRDRCAMCACDVSKKYHVDHIFPLSKGGKHEPGNLQILCPTCNVRKWAMLPHEFAQKMGKLI